MKRKSRLEPYSLDWLFRRISPEPNSGCWLWIGGLNAGGYGSIGMRGTTRNAHRVSYEMVKGSIGAGLDLDHLCRIRCCVNPDHLEPVTRGENLRRGDAGKHLIGAKTHCPKGHAYVGRNIFVDARGRRDCRTCRVRRTSEWRAKQRQGQGTAA